MTIHLKPELQALIQKDVQRGPYESADEFVERAVKLLHEQEEWVSENRAEIAAQVEHGFAQAERGELIDGEEAVRRLRERRKGRLKNR
jgi:putative addiction module CopG family antidote